MALTFFGVLSHTLQLDSAILVLVRNPNGISLVKKSVEQAVGSDILFGGDSNESKAGEEK